MVWSPGILESHPYTNRRIDPLRARVFENRICRARFSKNSLLRGNKDPDYKNTPYYKNRPGFYNSTQNQDLQSNIFANMIPKHSIYIKKTQTLKTYLENFPAPSAPEFFSVILKQFFCVKSSNEREREVCRKRNSPLVININCYLP